jgi:hypothetical protein
MHLTTIKNILKTSQSTKKKKYSRMPGTHAYNPSYSGGRDQENHGSKPAWKNSS